MNLETPSIPPPTLADLERLVASVKWRDSTTYPADMKHAYILKKDVPDVFVALQSAIQQYGYQDKFAGQLHTYLVIGQYKYWSYDTVLNREDIQLTIDRQKRAGSHE